MPKKNDDQLAERVKKLREKHSRGPGWPFPPPRTLPHGDAAPPRLEKEPTGKSVPATKT